MRAARLKMFIGSTVEEIEKAFNDHFKDDLCPGNVLKTNLYMLNGVYQYEVIYAEFIAFGQTVDRLYPLGILVEGAQEMAHVG